MGISLAKDCCECGRIFHQAISDDYTEYDYCEKCEQNKMTQENPTISNEMTVYRQSAIQKENQEKISVWSWWDRICWFFSKEDPDRQARYLRYLISKREASFQRRERKIINACKAKLLLQAKGHLISSTEDHFILPRPTTIYIGPSPDGEDRALPKASHWDTACRELNLYYLCTSSYSCVFFSREGLVSKEKEI